MTIAQKSLPWVQKSGGHFAENLAPPPIDIDIDKGKSSKDNQANLKVLR